MEATDHLEETDSSSVNIDFVIVLTDSFIIYIDGSFTMGSCWKVQLSIRHLDWHYKRRSS